MEDGDMFQLALGISNFLNKVTHVHGVSFTGFKILMNWVPVKGF